MQRIGPSEEGQALLLVVGALVLLLVIRRALRRR
jgi:hypothetical protein